MATAANTAALLVEVASIIFLGLIQELPDGVFRLWNAPFDINEEMRRHVMSLATQTQEEIRPGSPLKIPDGARILIVCDDNHDTERLRTILREEGFMPEWAKSMTAGCEAAKSGLFQVVVSTPSLKDGSWRRLSDIANHYNLGFEIVLWARAFDLREWALALEEGAFDVLDAMCEQPKAVEATKGALWAAYLKGAGPNPGAASLRRAAQFGCV